VPLLITVDTGILHLAAALDTRVLALHGPTASKRWGARNPNSASLDANHPSRGYMSLGFERHPDELRIMPTLSPDVVLEAARQILGAQLDHDGLGLAAAPSPTVDDSVDC
jgi:heptosyltransferase I